MFQKGFPDIYAHHFKYGQRWIEVKIEDHYSFTAAQREEFPKMKAAGCGIWILTGFTEADLALLFQPPNWEKYILRLGLRGLGR